MEEIMPDPAILGTVKTIAARIVEDNCPGYAAQMAYFFILSLFPFLLFLMTLLAYLPVKNLRDVIIESLRKVLPREALTLVEDNVQALVGEQKGGLLSFGILFAIWTSASGMTSIMDALNRVNRVKETRGFLMVQIEGVAMVIGFSLFIITASVLLIFGPKIIEAVAGRVKLDSWGLMLIRILRWPVALACAAITVSGIYWFGPAAVHEWHPVSWGSAFAVIAWVAASLGFSTYVNRFGTYNKTYGSIGAVIVLLSWLYISALVLLIGAEIDTVVY